MQVQMPADVLIPQTRAQQQEGCLQRPAGNDHAPASDEDRASAPTLAQGPLHAASCAHSIPDDLLCLAAIEQEQLAIATSLSFSPV